MNRARTGLWGALVWLLQPHLGLPGLKHKESLLILWLVVAPTDSSLTVRVDQFPEMHMIRITSKTRAVLGSTLSGCFACARFPLVPSLRTDFSKGVQHGRPRSQIHQRKATATGKPDDELRLPA